MTFCSQALVRLVVRVLDIEVLFTLCKLFETDHYVAHVKMGEVAEYRIVQVLAPSRDHFEDQINVRQVSLPVRLERSKEVRGLRTIEAEMRHQGTKFR